MLNGKQLIRLGTPVLGIALVGCVVPGPSIQDEVLTQQTMAAMIAQSSEYADFARKPETSKPPQLTSISESELKTKIDNLPTLSHGVLFERKRDGFDVEGVRYIDPEGEIVAFGTDYATGDVTYLARTGAGEYLVKFVRVLTQADPITIATATRDAAGWQIALASGKTIRGDRIIPMSKGVVITRAATAFRYVPGDGIKNFAALDGWHIASYQNGDVSSTGYILLERTPVKKRSGLDGLISSAKSIGHTLGVAQKYDYMLVHVDSGKAVPFNVGMDSAREDYLASCFNCDNFTNSGLWDQNGIKNFKHYYWRVQWLHSPRGPIAVVQENGLKDITVTDLRTGEKAVAFSRPLGISAYDVRQSADGTVSIVAQMGLTPESLPDAVAFLDEHGKVPSLAEASPDH